MEKIDQEGTNRRKFMGRVIVAISGIVGVSLIVPFLGYVIGPALRRRPLQLDNAGPIAGLVPGHPQDMQTVVELRDGWRSTNLVRTVWVV
ncbi:MAG TPA: hypothetical protein VGB26_00665 [Nitrospiria bacterium]|jgi:hypothetical protein